MASSFSTGAGVFSEIRIRRGRGCDGHDLPHPPAARATVITVSGNGDHRIRQVNPMVRAEPSSLSWRVPGQHVPSRHLRLDGTPGFDGRLFGGRGLAWQPARVPDDPVPDDAAGLRAANARLRGLLEDRDALIAGLAAELEAARERERLLGLRLAELERRLGMDSSNSGTPSSKEGIAAGEKRKARQRSERVRSKDRKPGGQPGHPGKGLARDPDPGERRDTAPPAECRKCSAGLGGAIPAGQRWAQCWDVRISRVVTEWGLPGLMCPCCGEVTFAAPPPGQSPTARG
jgi:hypothetical protein